MTIHIPAWVNGELVPVEKLDAHKRGLRHKAISVFLIRDGEILIQRRALAKYHTPGLWANTCCTHPFWEEDALTCATRRLTEELGIKGVPLTYRDQVEYRADVGNDLIEHELVDIYTSQIEGQLLVDLNPDEVMEVRWISPGDLRAEMAATPEIFTPWFRIYMAEHAAQIFGDLKAA